MEQQNNICVLWEKIDGNSARILRVYAAEPTVRLPDTIGDITVTEIGDYCFATHAGPCGNFERTVLFYDDRKDKWESKDATDEDMAGFRELCGDYLSKISLPRGLLRLGNLAFYNCTSLERIRFGARLCNIGSDAFMNCKRLHRLEVCCSVTQKSGVRQILAQVYWDIEVAFLLEDGISAIIFYPEYYESYDEIAPAHIFGRKIEGEGFRARLSFQDEVADLAQYDKIFPRACVEETKRTLLTLACTRLRYPVGMTLEARERYQTYVGGHETEAAEALIREKNLVDFHYFLKEKLITQVGIQAAIETASSMEWAEGISELLHFKQEFFGRTKQERYAFDAF